MKKVCANCKHWTRSTDLDASYHGPDSGQCKSDKFVYDEQPIPEDSLSYWDYESYAAGFRTGAAFGCIHFAPKEPQ